MARPALASPAVSVRGDRRALMADEVRAGLSLPLPTIPCKYFYDARGSRLFEKITTLPEYYPTRTEDAILLARADALAQATRAEEVLELGSGASPKLRRLLDALARSGSLRACTLLDISESALLRGARALRRAYPGMVVQTVVADFTADLIPVAPRPGRLVAFLGGTVGNLHPDAVSGFLRTLAALLQPPGFVLMGVDLVKPRAVLEAAYDDAQGVTAAFNRNVLTVLNRELGADFDRAGFDHVAFWDEEHAWIEMRLRARRPMVVHVAGLRLTLQRGDDIRTELSCKYTEASFTAQLPGTGLQLERWVTDPQGLFALALLRRAQ